MVWLDGRFLYWDCGRMIIGVRFVGLTDQLERSMGVLICMQMIVVWEGLLLVLGL